MRVKVILNPYANRWRAREQAAAVAAAFRAAGVDCDLTITTTPGEGTPLAEAAARDGYDAVVAAGGDGTINEVINGLLRAGHSPTRPFGIIPLGTANDFNLNIPRYVDTFEADQSIDLSLIGAAISQIEAELTKVQDSIERYLEELGL